MSVIDFSAHRLTYQIMARGHEDPETGDYVQGETNWSTESYKCDIVPAGRANTIPIPDGSVQDYSYTIYNLPRDCQEFQYGDKIKLQFYGKGDGKIFKVLGFHRYQHQCKIWI